MIDHTGVGVTDFSRSRAFYGRALEPLGYHEAMIFGDEAAGFAAEGGPDFWIEHGKANDPPIHVAFRAEQRDQVDAFYHTALEAGGQDNGAPGLREDYGPDYYAAYILDPDGHNIEAVCHG